MEGRVLVIEGLEKAERNILPIIVLFLHSNRLQCPYYLIV